MTLPPPDSSAKIIMSALPVLMEPNSKPCGAVQVSVPPLQVPVAPPAVRPDLPPETWTMLAPTKKESSAVHTMVPLTVINPVLVLMVALLTVKLVD
jgi:hypothetical protein